MVKESHRLLRGRQKALEKCRMLPATRGELCRDTFRTPNTWTTAPCRSPLAELLASRRRLN